jgi:hypothetical protein
MKGELSHGRTWISALNSGRKMFPILRILLHESEKLVANLFRFPAVGPDISSDVAILSETFRTRMTRLQTIQKK